METLLNSWEVHKFSPIAGSFQGDDFAPYILPVERNIFLPHKELYHALIADLNHAVANAATWKSGVEYSEGDIVIFDGVSYVATDDTSSRPPCDWVKICRFSTQCFCDLWQYVAPWVSCNVVKVSLPTIYMKVSPQGVVVNQSGDYIPTDDRGLDKMQRHFDNLSSLHFRNLQDYICKTDCLEDYRGCFECKTDCEEQDCRRNYDGGLGIGLVKKYGL